MATTSSEMSRPGQPGVEEFQRPVRSLWSDAWGRLRRNKLAMIGLFYIFFLSLVAIAAPVLAPHSPARPIGAELRERGAYRQAAWVESNNEKKTGLWTYPLGTDSGGGDVLSRLIYGTRVSLVVGFIPMIFTLLIGVTMGLVSGYAGGALDSWMMRFTDVVFALPDILFFIIVQTAFGKTTFGRTFNGLLLIFVSFSVVSWAGVARLVRGQVLSLKEKEFVEAAHAVGVKNNKILTRHILPNTLAPIIVAAAFIVPGAIVTEAVLSFLGIGIQPNTSPTNPFPTSWGQMIFEGKSGIDSQPWILISSAIAIASITIAFVALGDGLRDALDPRN
ncbi:MAG: ABC transporter permease [Herpetosiphonaceae bacterium]|nr:ABC transporter permease [Herpetosiphonaceae bacterium]